MLGGPGICCQAPGGVEESQVVGYTGWVILVTFLGCHLGRAHWGTNALSIFALWLWASPLSSLVLFSFFSIK